MLMGLERVNNSSSMTPRLMLAVLVHTLQGAPTYINSYDFSLHPVSQARDQDQNLDFVSMGRGCTLVNE